MNSGFQLAERLAADTVGLGDLDLCRVMLMDDSRFPWLVLVPRRAGMREIHALTLADRAVLIEEVGAAARCLETVTRAAKMNVAALGNQVAQLHVHVIARQSTDAAWPNPVWGMGARVAYAPGEAATLIAAVKLGLGLG